jgi:hypothetical protein
VNPIFKEEKQKKRDELIDPYWALDKQLREGPMEFLDKGEIDFWVKFIKRYLYPLEGNKEHEKKVARELIELRNKVCLAFLLMNALFVTIVYTLTEVNKSEGSLSIALPCGDTGSSSGGKSEGNTGQGHIEPISFAFTAVFGIMLLIQFVCMLFHRYSTLLHIIASAELKIKKTIQKAIGGEQEVEVNDIDIDDGLDLVRQMQASNETDTASVSLDAFDAAQDVETSHDDEMPGEPKGKDLWNKLQKRRKQMAGNTLSKNFIRNFAKLQKVVELDDTASITPMSGDNVDNAEDRMGNVQKQFGRRKLTRKSLATIVTIVQNDSIKDEIKKRAEQLNKIEQLKKDRRRALLRKAVINVRAGQRPRTSLGTIVTQKQVQQRLEKIDDELSKQTKTDDQPASPGLQITDSKPSDISNSDVLF